MAPLDRTDIEKAIIRTYRSRLIHHEIPSVPELKIVWTLKGRSTAGEFLTEYDIDTPHTYKIRLNPGYFAAAGDNYISTAVHEACHAVTVVIRRHRGIPQPKGESGKFSNHGAFWKSEMIACGYEPDRCIDPELASKVAPARVVQRFPVYCKCEVPNQVTAVMIRRIRSGQDRQCVKCRTNVTLR
jgi:predicted SprT family Zn-dependent metalloprotease